jgi:hypothetical protein
MRWAASARTSSAVTNGSSRMSWRTYVAFFMPAPRERLVSKRSSSSVRRTVKIAMVSFYSVCHLYVNYGAHIRPTRRLLEREAFAFNEKLGDEPGVALACHQLGVVAREQNDLAAAESWYRKALAIKEKHGDERRDEDLIVTVKEHFDLLLYSISGFLVTGVFEIYTLYSWGAGVVEAETNHGDFTTALSSGAPRCRQPTITAAGVAIGLLHPAGDGPFGHTEFAREL